MFPLTQINVFWFQTHLRLYSLFMSLCLLSSAWLRSGPEGAGPRRSVLKPAPALRHSWESGSGVLCLFSMDDRLFTLVARHLIGQLGTVIVSLLTNDLPFKHVYSLHINRFPFAALVFSAAVCSLKVSRSLHDSLFSRPRPSKDPAPLAAAPELAPAGAHANSCCNCRSPSDLRYPWLLRLLPTSGH